MLNAIAWAKWQCNQNFTLLNRVMQGYCVRMYALNYSMYVSKTSDQYSVSGDDIEKYL